MRDDPVIAAMLCERRESFESDKLLDEYIASLKLFIWDWYLNAAIAESEQHFARQLESGPVLQTRIPVPRTTFTGETIH